MTVGRSPAEREHDQTVTVGLLVAASIGLLVNLNPWGAVQTSDLPTIGFALTALISVFLFPVRDQASAWARWRPVWAYAAFLGWTLLASLTSGRVFSALTGSGSAGIGWVVLVLCGAIATGAMFDAANLRRMFGEVYAPAVLWIESCIVVYQVTAGQHGAGTLSNSSFLGMLLVLLIPVAAAGIPENPDRTRMIWHWGGVALAVLAIAASGSRVALGAALVWLAWTAFKLARSRGAAAVRLAAALAIVAAAAVGLLVAFAGAEASVRAVGGSLSDRATKVLGAWRAGMARPVTGWGPDGFFFGSSRTLPANALEVYGGLGQVSTDPHNILAWVLVSAGFVGVALFCWVAFEIARNWRRQQRSKKLNSAAAWGVALVALVALTSPVPIQILPLVVIVAGLSLRMERRAAAPATAGSWPVVLRWVLGALAALLLAYSLSRMPLGRIDRLGQQAPGRLTHSVARIWSFDPFLWYRASLDLGYDAAANPRVAVGQPDLAAIRRAVALEPGHAIYRLELARTLAFYGAPRAEVEKAFQEAIALFPASAEGHASYGLYLLEAADLEAAKRQLDIALASEPGNAVTNDLAAAYYEKIGQPEKAAEFRRRANETRQAQNINANK